MKLEKRDIAECLGLTYMGERWDFGNNKGCFVFDFNGETLEVGGWNTEESAWREAADKVLQPLVELLKDKLTA